MIIDSTAAPAYPVPPADLSASQAMSTLFLVVCAVFFAVMAVHAIREGIRRDFLLLACLVGGLGMSMLEPILDYLGLLWFAEDNVAIAIETVGRHIPLYVVLGYAFFFGFQAYIAYRAILAGKSARYLAGIYAFAWVFDLGLQATGRAFGLYEYYGNQPYLIFGVPAWWFSIDALLPIIAGAAFFALREKLSGWGVLLAVPLLPALYAGLNGAAGWPVFTALNSNYDPVVNGNGSDWQTWLGGTGTIALCLFFLWLVVDWIGKEQRRTGALASVEHPARVAV